jgi:integrase
LIIGYTGACRRDEITKMLIEDVEIRADAIMISIPKTKNNVSRLFVITEESWIGIIKKYINLRPNSVTHKRLILTYRSGHCISSPIGINTIGKMPRIIAEYLKLPNPELYTGHCLRRSSITHLANAGGDLVTIKRHGGWRSSSVAEGYIDNSIKKKMEVAEMFAAPSTSDSSRCVAKTSVPAKTPSVPMANTIIEAAGDQNVQQNFVSNENLPNIVVHAKDTANVTIKVFTDCTVHNC